MLDVTDLTVRYGPLTAVDRLDLHAADGEVVAVLGPSGCGKSTLLRAIAGLERPTRGRITIDGRDVTDLRADRRDVGLMFQDHALFPHRTVADNVAFGPRMRRMGRHDIDRRVAQVLALVDLTGADDRPVTELSGGEQQRVALARAIAPRPRLLMLDEPLGSLDRVLRDRLLGGLPEVFRAIGTTVLYVTHDQQEALALADRVAVMRAGRFVQQGTPTQLWREPRTEFVARFVGLEVVLDADVRAGIATTPLGRLPLPDHPDGPTRLVLLPDAVRLLGDTDDTGDPDDTDGPSSTGDPDDTDVAVTRPTAVSLSGVVRGRRFAGDHLRFDVATDAGVRLMVPVWRGVGPALGDRVRLAIDPSAVRSVAADGDVEPTAS